MVVSKTYRPFPTRGALGPYLRLGRVRLAADGFSAFAAPEACTRKAIALYGFSFMRLITVV
jgi:hypothetical protein